MLINAFDYLLTVYLYHFGYDNYTPLCVRPKIVCKVSTEKKSTIKIDDNYVYPFKLKVLPDTVNK